MPWTPQNDFEEEVVNLQPDHDFIFGYLSEPQYPRPTSHMEYASTRKLQEEQQQRESEADSAISAKLRIIQQVQRIANTKPVGEQPSLDDWNTNENLERETIGMMRHFGLDAGVEQPLNQTATIASYPIKNTTKVLRTGNQRIPLLLDDNMFKLREKGADTSSGFESCNNSGLNKFKSDKADSLASELEGATSFSTSSSFSFNTPEEYNDSFASAASNVTGPSKKGMNQYDKLVENTSSLSLNCSKSSSCSQQESSESFRTSSSSSWVPVSEDDEYPFNKDSWPALSKEGMPSDINSKEDGYLFNNAQNNVLSEPKREDFLDRLLKSIKDDDNIDATTSSTSDTTSDSASATSSQKPKTYANITKAPKSSTKKKKSTTPDLVTDFPAFSTLKMYPLKRKSK